MKFIVIAKDKSDDGALERRLSVRDKHVSLGNKMRDNGSLLYAGALLNDRDQMNGSVMVLDFDSRESLNQWLENEPYVTGNVWEEIQIERFQIGPSFLKGFEI